MNTRKGLRGGSKHRIALIALGEESLLAYTIHHARATNTKSPCATARPQPSAASAESAASSRSPGFILF